MQVDDRNRLEEELQALCRRGEVNQAVEQALRGYGPEIRRLMVGVLQNEDRAQDAFSLFSEFLLKGLPRFRWESSFRTWAQRMARNACFKLVNAPAIRHRHVSLSAVPEQPIGRHSTTCPWQRTHVKARFRALREKLEPQEQRLLELRVDQQLQWPQIVQLLAASNEPITGELLARRATALRQQFQRVKSRMRTLAQQEGIIASDGTCA